MRNSNHLAVMFAVFVLGMALAMPSALAGEKKGGKEREAARRMQLLQQRFAEEKATLEKDKTELAQKVEELTNQADKAKQGAERKRAALEKDMVAVKEESTALQDKLQQLEVAYTGLTLRHKEESEKNHKQIAQLQAALAQRGQSLGACEEKNGKLYRLNREILAKYRDKGLIETLSQAEPITGIKAVEIDNILEEYRDKLDAQRVEGAK